MDLYWLHCIGPDGPCVLLGIHHSRFDIYDLPDDSRDGEAFRVDEQGRQWLHKWQVVRREPFERPAFNGAD